MNRAYNGAYSALWRGEVDWIEDDIRVLLVRGSLYAFSASHQTLAQIPSGARASDVALTGRTESGGTAFAADPTWPMVPVGADVTAVVVYAQGASDAESRLLLWLDELDGLPRPTGGTDVMLSWPASGVAKLRDPVAAAESEATARIESTIYTSDASNIDPPAWATHVLLEAIGGGGGGGSGRRSSATTTALGGAGGCAGQVRARLVPVDDLAGPLSVTIGVGGAGGAGIAGPSANSNGNTGSDGGDTVVSDGTTEWLTAAGGTGGLRGTSVADNVEFLGGVGTAGGARHTNILGGRPGRAAPAIGGGGGGAGAGAGATTLVNGGPGGDGRTYTAVTSGGAAGVPTPPDQHGTAGESVPPTEWGGGGGGGGGANATNQASQDAGDGGAGGEPGGGGGGGGGLRAASTNVAGSGAGGDGGRGRARITWIGVDP